ncbi:MAG: rod-binding protein [Campylobacteraceae bacterium]|nr:rod-binding protein [Campylobacteraceae bacterium]
MDINTNYVDINTIKKSPSDNYKNLDSSKLEDESLRKVSNDFEAFFMKQLLDVSLKDSTFAGEGSGSDIIKGMYTDTISRQSAGTLGISDMLYNFLSERKK